MKAPVFEDKNHLGEPVIIQKGYQLCALMDVCERVARSLDDAGDGKYHDRITSSLAVTLELAHDVAFDLLVALEKLEPKRMTGGEREG